MKRKLAENRSLKNTSHHSILTPAWMSFAKALAPLNDLALRVDHASKPALQRRS